MKRKTTFDQWEQQRSDYAVRGISLVYFESDTRLPSLVNLDEDTFRNERFMYILKPGVTRFGGASGDIRPTSGTVIEDHCTIYHAALNQSVDHTLVRSRVCSLLAGLGPGQKANLNLQQMGQQLCCRFGRWANFCSFPQ